MKKLIAYFMISYSLIAFSATTNAALPLTIAGNDIFSLAPLVEKVSPAVVNISIAGNQSNQKLLPDLFKFFSDDELPFMNQPFVGLGSGVIIDAAKGYIITNFHVIEDAEEIKVTLKSGQEFNALLVGQDKQSDIALLQISTHKSLTQM
ncbi:MAG: S1-C subfamily serine protease, partial [Psychromonas sp.]